MREGIAALAKDRLMCLRNLGNVKRAHEINSRNRLASSGQKVATFGFRLGPEERVSATVSVVAAQTPDEIDQEPDLSLA
jgi:hypothetical protein